MKSPAGRGLLHIFVWPLVIAGITIAALLSGLLGAGWVDWLAVALLALPVALCGRGLWSGGRRDP